MTVFNEKRVPGLLHQTLYLVFFTSLVFSLRAVSSITLTAIVLVSTFGHSRFWTTILQLKARNLFFIGSSLLILLHLLALLYTIDLEKGWASVRIKSGLLITGLAACLPGYTTQQTKNKLLFYYSLILAAGSLYCLLVAFTSFRKTGETSVFFYHELVTPLQQHAIYLSVLVVIGLIFLLENLRQKEYFVTLPFHIGIVLYLSLFLLLLASKFVISFYIVYLGLYTLAHLQRNKVNKLALTSIMFLCLTAVGLFLITRNPVRERFDDILKGDLQLVRQDKFSQGVYFNGVQFRLLQWRFVPEILTENNAWWLGVSPGDAQEKLNKKYISSNMYTGNPVTGDRGYLAYNTHNQFLETALQTGILGLCVLLLICYSLVRMAIRSRNKLFSFVIILLLAWMFSEAALETQYGIIIFTFFPLLLYTNNSTPGTADIAKPTF